MAVAARRMNPAADQTSSTVNTGIQATIGARGEPVPRRFITLGARSVELTDILDRWPGLDHGYVKLRGTDGASYILRHDESAGARRLVQHDTNQAHFWARKVVSN